MCNESARSAALSELVVKLVDDSLTEYTYAAYVAELEYQVRAIASGFQVKHIKDWVGGVGFVDRFLLCVAPGFETRHSSGADS